MTVQNTRGTKEIERVAATMAVENMYLSEKFVSELIKVAEGKKTSEELRQEVLKKYARS